MQKLIDWLKLRLAKLVPFKPLQVNFNEDSIYSHSKKRSGSIMFSQEDNNLGMSLPKVPGNH